MNFLSIKTLLPVVAFVELSSGRLNTPFLSTIKQIEKTTSNHYFYHRTSSKELLVFLKNKIS